MTVTARPKSDRGQGDIKAARIGHREGTEVFLALRETVGVGRSIGQFREEERLAVSPAFRVELVNVDDDVRERGNTRSKGPRELRKTLPADKTGTTGAVVSRYDTKKLASALRRV